MEDDLIKLVKSCFDNNVYTGLNNKIVDEFCDKNNLTQEQFYDIFAKHIALEFAKGEMSYSDGDVAMNDLASFAEINITPLALEIYLIFDAGEYHRSSDPAGTIPWQKYTLPNIMHILLEEGLLP